MACTSSIRCIAYNVDTVFDSVGNVAGTVPIGVVVKRNQVWVEENPDAAHDGDDHGKHHDDAEDFTHGILIFSSATPTHLDLPLFTVVLRLHLGIDLKVAVLQQFSLNALNGVGGESISISATDKVRKLRPILERNVDVALKHFIDFKQDRGFG